MLLGLLVLPTLVCCPLLWFPGRATVIDELHTFRVTKGPEKSVLRKQEENKSPKISWDLDHTRRLSLRSQNKAGFVDLEPVCVSTVCFQHSLSKLLNEKPQNPAPELYTITSPSLASSATLFSPDNQHSHLPGCLCKEKGADEGSGAAWTSLPACGTGPVAAPGMAKSQPGSACCGR